MKASSARLPKSLSLIVVAVLLATFQLIKFDRVIAHTSGWTDGQAESWTVFSPLIDTLILLAVVLLILSGTYLGLKKPKHQSMRIVLSILAALVVWFVFYAIQLTIQQHLSHFRGV
jgi:hypothetical protein